MKTTIRRRMETTFSAKLENILAMLFKDEEEIQKNKLDVKIFNL